MGRIAAVLLITFFLALLLSFATAIPRAVRLPRLTMMAASATRSHKKNDALASIAQTPIATMVAGLAGTQTLEAAETLVMARVIGALPTATLLPTQAPPTATPFIITATPPPTNIPTEAPTTHAQSSSTPIVAGMAGLSGLLITAGTVLYLMAERNMQQIHTRPASPVIYLPCDGETDSPKAA